MPRRYKSKRRRSHAKKRSYKKRSHKKRSYQRKNKKGGALAHLAQSYEDQAREWELADGRRGTLLSGLSLPQPSITDSTAQAERTGKRRRSVSNVAECKAWSAAEDAKLLRLVNEAEKSGRDWKWREIAVKLGTDRTHKSVHTHWMRLDGRIVDRQRTRATDQKKARAEKDKERHQRNKGA